MTIQYASSLTFAGLVHAFCLLASPQSLAAENLALKKTDGLKGSRTASIAPLLVTENKKPGLLGKMNLFRGVEVAEAGENLKPSSSFSVADTVKPLLRPRFGGLQLSLRDNMSLVYMPGKLSRSAINTESQGLYLLNNQDGFANWFVGMESNAYTNRVDNRKVSTSTQIGVIFNLD